MVNFGHAFFQATVEGTPEARVHANGFRASFFLGLTPLDPTAISHRWREGSTRKAKRGAMLHR
jgi:hypothetical protein